MDKRFVEGTDRPVGVSQLLTAIDNTGTMPKENLPKWLRGVKKIIPVIITKDDIGSSWIVAQGFIWRSICASICPLARGAARGVACGWIIDLLVDE